MAAQSGELPRALRPCEPHGTLWCMELGRARNAVSQLRRGTLEYCVLALLRDGRRYGFELVRTLSEADGLLVSEGTIYPLLSRLRRDRLVSTSWQESETGPPRRYYQLTDAGQRALADFSDEWARFRDSVDAVLTTQGDGQ
jgi:PadR family transcriptional regulator PadR